VDGDLEQLHLVFVNILINAVEANENGGTIVVTANHQNDSIVIDVRDSGHGIPTDILPRLFEPFVTTKENGTGLGLALCHRVVTNHQGTIMAKNQPQGGTVFRVQLPTATVAEATSLSL
jgi:signal transduction histidine kinase